jgi:reductive dehalogenase
MKKGILTNKILGQQEQIREKDHAHAKAARGAFGENIMNKYHAVTFEAPIFSMCFPIDRPFNSLTRTLTKYVDGPVNQRKKEFEATEEASKTVKGVARMFGADLVGVCKLEKPYIYSHQGAFFHWVKGTIDEPINLEHKYAISIGIEMDYRRTKASPSFIADEEVALGYIRNCVTSTLLAQYIREIGYSARAHNILNEQVIHPPLAVMAGLGEIGRCGFLLTKEFGNRLRLSTVTTDLPLKIDEPVDFGIVKVCEICKKCASNCPSGAIPDGDRIVVRGIEKWMLNDEACIRFWQSNPSQFRSCENCIAVCPLSKPNKWWHALSWFFADKSKLAKKLLLWIDDVIYGKKPRPYVKWLDYEFNGKRLIKGMADKSSPILVESPFKNILKVK